jgi:hypothetical protein
MSINTSILEDVFKVREPAAVLNVTWSKAHSEISFWKIR